MKLKLFIFLFALMTSAVTLFASNNEVDGVWYDFDAATNTASVTFRGYKAETYSNEYSGSVIIPETVIFNENTYTVISIGHEAFYNCATLTSVTIPSSVTKIDYSAFKSCGLTTLILPYSVKRIGQNAFAYNSQLTQVTLPDNEVYIEANAFYNCTNLSIISLPNTHGKIMEINRTSFEGTAFYNDESNWENDELYFEDCLLCANLSKTGVYTIKDGTRVIAGGAFYQCNMSSVVMPNTVVNISGYYGTITSKGWGSCPNLKYVTLSENITKIPKWAFYNAPKLKKIIIPDKVDTIEAYAFGNCSNLDTIIIGNGIEYIAQNAISWCYDINVEFTSPTPPDVMMTYSYEAFSGSNPQFYVPCGSISAYKSEISSYSNDHWHEKVYIPYTIDTSNGNMGYVTITQTPTCETPEVSFYATPLEGYAFKQWSDGNEDNPRVIALTQETELTALWTSTIFLTDAEDPMPAINAAVTAGGLYDVTIERIIYRNGDYNTICLPFDITDVSTSALSDFTVKEFINATVIDDDLLIELSEVATIEANKPYFIKYNGNDTPLSSITFKSVTLNNYGASYIEKGDIVLHGTIEPFYMNAQTSDNHSYLYLGLGNTLYWPNVSNNVKPFRAYFSFSPAGKLNSPIKKGMPARIVEHKETATALNPTLPSKGYIHKIIKNGQLYIIKNGIIYNMQGQIVR